MPAAPSARGSANPADDDRAVFAQLTPLLARYGLDATEVEHEPLLLVSNGGRPATYIYVATNPLLHEPAVYGFVDLYLGQVADLEGVAVRLAWLLGVPHPIPQPNEPPTR